ncbi:hypothetical protein CDAR_603551 [Caerostris darwini]|uniref:Uncharacterized protein n=1 Tax=Caerostris darwini TaxID=1538125 RepID=A0AAV4T740_9ARAC|nr:hypothetical protein CDAR_603551 [Caerostris darwini]
MSGTVTHPFIPNPPVRLLYTPPWNTCPPSLPLLAPLTDAGPPNFDIEKTIKKNRFPSQRSSKSLASHLLEAIRKEIVCASGPFITLTLFGKNSKFLSFSFALFKFQLKRKKTFLSYKCFLNV